ncbi:hypothetical protein [Promicromonospora kroppenstedtii]|uniref:hypothetical protein n=1 Tax=Promicromonospora kroppenstedtii TaxID=440482 RepID=UPI00055C524D|nr:hypothetical protein [Promicromonospora kroppenstedtii]
MHELPEASRWMVERFGEHAHQVRVALAEAARASQEYALDAKAGSKLESNEAYGALWRILGHQVATHMNFLPGHEQVHPKDSRFPLIVFRGTLVFPVRYSSSPHGGDKIRIDVSEYRARVYALNGREPEAVQGHLDLGQEFDAGRVRVVRDGSFGSAERVMTVACAVSARGGLQHVYYGEAAPDTLGYLDWTHLEELPQSLLDNSITGLALVSDPGVGGRFDQAPLPESPISLRTDTEGDQDQNQSATGGGGE